MKEQLGLLYQLQQIDTARARDSDAVKALDDGSGTAAELEAARGDLEQMEAEGTRSQADLRDKELRLAGTEEDGAKRAKEAATSTNAKQVEALGKKIAELDRLKDKLEGEILALLDQVDEQDSSLQEQRSRILELERQLEDMQRAFAEESARLQGELADLETQREALIGQIEPQLLTTYEQLRSRAGNLAVAAVVNNACEGCHTQLPMARLGQVRQGILIIKCELCHRILVWPE